MLAAKLEGYLQHMKLNWLHNGFNFATYDEHNKLTHQVKHDSTIRPLFGVYNHGTSI